MDGCKDNKRRGSLLEKRTRRDKLEGEGEEVNDEKCTKLDTTWEVGLDGRKGWRAT
jgi:hypothetical protein